MRIGRAAATVILSVAAALLLVCGPADAAGEVGAIGRIEPSGGVIDLTGTPGTAVKDILVKPHDAVHRGDVLAVLSNHDVLEVELEIARAELAGVDKQAKDQIALQRAVLAAARLRLSQAKAAMAEYQGLGANTVAQAELTRRRDLAATAESDVAIESARLAQVEHQVELDRAHAKLELRRAETRYQAVRIVAPSDGTVLEVLKQIGERVGGTPVIRMADLSRMDIVCDVFEGDVLKLKQGMPASASSKSLPQSLEGVVQRIDRIVNTERKLATVVIRLNRAEAAARLIGMEVQVTIRTGGGS